MSDEPPPEAISAATNGKGESQGNSKPATEGGEPVVKQSPADSHAGNATDHESTSEVDPEMAALRVVVTFHGERVENFAWRRRFLSGAGHEGGELSTASRVALRPGVGIWFSLLLPLAHVQ